MVTIHDKAVPRGRREARGKLRIARRPATWLIDHLTHSVTSHGTRPHASVELQIADFVYACLDVVASTFRLTDAQESIDRLAGATSSLASSGMPLDSLLRTLHEGVRADLGTVIGDLARVAATADDENGDTPTVVDVLAMLTEVICTAFVKEIRDIAAAHDVSAHALASALLAGRPHAEIAHEYGIDLHERYFVLAFFFSPSDDEGAMVGFDEIILARRRRIRVEAILTERLGYAPLSTLGARSGTILLPAVDDDPRDIDTVVEGLSEYSGTAIVVTVDLAPIDELRAAAGRVHELLRVVVKLGYGPGLYRMQDLALEYQLTRPGPAREILAAYLDPLEDHPELKTTLEHYIRSGLRRNRTAQLLQVHPNTVDNRLKRIMELVKPNHYDPSDLWQLRSAWIARTFRR